MLTHIHVMMAALYRGVLFKRVSKLNAAHPQWKTPGCFLRGGKAAIIHSATNLSTMTGKPSRMSESSAGCGASSQDGKARVKRVSIEGNIGKNMTRTYNSDQMYNHRFMALLFVCVCGWYVSFLGYVISTTSCGKVNLCKTPPVSLSRLGGDGRTSQQVAAHWERHLTGEQHISWFLSSLSRMETEGQVDHLC